MQKRFPGPEAAIAEAMQTVLKGYRFNKRLLAPGEGDHWLLFSRGESEVALVGWTTADTNRVALAPATPMVFNAYSWNGTQLGTVNTQDYEIGMVLEKQPKVLIPQQPNPFLQFAARAQTVEPVIRVKGPRTLELTCDFYNPTSEVAVMAVPDMDKMIAVQPGATQTIRKTITVGRSAEPIRTSIGAMGINQPVTIIVENPLELLVRPEEPRMLTLDVVNPGGEEMNGQVVFSLGGAGEPFRSPLEIKRGQRLQTLRIPLGSELPLPGAMQVSIEQSVAQPMRQTYVLARTGALQFVPTGNFLQTTADNAPAGYEVVETANASAALRGGTPNTPIPWPAQGALSIVYDLGSQAERPDNKSISSVGVKPVSAATAQVPGTPSQVAFWLQGDGTGNLVSVSWRDAAGREHTSDPQPLNWTGWRYVTFDAPTRAVSYPLQWASLLSVTAAPGGSLQSRRGSLLANGFCFIYGANRSLSAYEQAPVNYEDTIMPAVPTEVKDSEVLGDNAVKFKEPVR